jgi:hypothetical protein
MSLVPYSSSSSDEDLPSHGTTPERIRSVPHREGHWACHVYIPSK